MTKNRRLKIKLTDADGLALFTEPTYSSWTTRRRLSIAAILQACWNGFMF